MNVPGQLQHGLDFFSVIPSKIREIIDYLKRSRLIAGHGIRIREDAAGIVIESTAKENNETVSGTIIRSGGYPADAPFALSYDPETYMITMKSGMVQVNVSLSEWTGDCSISAMHTTEDKFVVFHYVSDLRSTISLADVSSSFRLDTRDIVLGIFRASSKSVDQFFFSPVMKMMEVSPFGS